MTDDSKKPLTKEELDDEAALDGMLGDFDASLGKPSEETLESVRAERDKLREQLAETFLLNEQAIKDLQTKQKQLLDQIDSLKSAATRAEAKFAQDKDLAVSSFVKDALPVLDTMQIAINSISTDKRAEDKGFDSLAVGIEKTRNQLLATFNKYGIREINPINQEFDENKHEALAIVPKADVEPGTVIKVEQTGFEISVKGAEGDVTRIIRPARVIITPLD